MPSAINEPGGSSGSYELGDAVVDDSPAIAPSLEGKERTLRRVLVETGPLPWQQVVRLGIQVATQLHSFHSRGVCPHGSVCPETIFEAPDGNGYILALPAMRPGLAYRAPETHATHSGSPDARADVFSLGVVLFEALAGDRMYPFRVAPIERSDTPLHHYSYLPQNDLGSLAPTIPVELRRVIERATRLVPENRFHSPLALAEALQTVLHTPPTKSRPTPQQRRLLGKRFRPVLGVFAIALVIAVLGVELVLLQSPRAPSTATDTQRLRREALEASAPSLAPELWLAAEQAAARQDLPAQQKLYAQARDAAWQKRLAEANAAAQHAVHFEATGEAAFARAHDARLRALHLWEAHRVSEALQSLAEAKEFYHAAIHTRRDRWVTALRAQLRSEAGRVTTGLYPEDSDAIRAIVDEVEKTLGAPDVTVDELRKAESHIADLRQLVTAALNRAGQREAARQRAVDSIERAQLAGRAAELAVQAFPSLGSGLARGKEFLDAARQAVDHNPSQAVTLADAALHRFRQIESKAEQELARERQVAARARRQALDANATELAADAYASGEEHWQKAENRQSDWAQRKKSYQQAKVAFERAHEEALAAAARVSLASTPPLVAPTTIPTPRADTSSASTRVQNVLKMATVPSPPVLKPHLSAKERMRESLDSPMPVELATNIQSWLRERCETLNRTLARTSGGRARCEDLVVHDRRDHARIQVTYSLTYGSLIPEGIRWDVPAQRSATLDCSTGACHCISGDGC